MSSDASNLALECAVETLDEIADLVGADKTKRSGDDLINKVRFIVDKNKAYASQPAVEKIATVQGSYYDIGNRGIEIVIAMSEALMDKPDNEKIERSTWEAHLDDALMNIKELLKRNKELECLLEKHK